VERTRRRNRALAAATAVLSVVLLSGCASGFGATSIQPYAPSDGVLANTGELRILNVIVVSTGANGVVSATIVNRGRLTDSLEDMTSPDGTVDLTGDGKIPPGGTITLGADTETSATISGLTKLPGETITLKLTFHRADPVTIRTLVAPASGYYASVTPAPTASE
jgi:hypothetical protein